MVHMLTAQCELGCDARAIVYENPLGSELEAELSAHQVPVYHLGKQRGPSPLLPFRISRALQDFKPDVVHTHLNLLRYALLPALACRAPVLVHTLHTTAQEEAEGIERWLRSITFNHRITPIAVSDAVSHSVEAVYGISNCQVIHLGIPTSGFSRPVTGMAERRARLGIPAEAVVIVCVARLAEVKNHRLLLDAFAAIDPVQRNTWLVIVGGGPLREELTAYAAQPQFGGQALVLGPREDLLELLWTADIAALTSVREGIPLSLMEAMASGNALVCTAVGGMPELVGNSEAGFVVPTKDLTALTSALKRLIDEPALRTEMALAATRRVQTHFDSRLMGRRYLELYSRLLDEARARRN